MHVFSSIWNDVSVSTCGGLIHGGLIFGGGGGGYRGGFGVFKEESKCS
jgi:hypothetical protein